MRRFFLPFLLAALWLASLAGAGWMRADCIRVCAAAVQVESGHARPCCAKHGGGAKLGACAPAQCPKCQAVAKALLAMAPVADAPLFFDAACGRLEPVVVASSEPVVLPARSWRWSLPPPDTLLKLRCSFLL